MISYRVADAEDADAVVDLAVAAIGPRQRWTADGWRQWHFDYPGERPWVWLAQEPQGRLVGHTSLLPVSVCGHPVVMQANVIVGQGFRDGTVLSRLLEDGMMEAARRGASFVFAFAQPRFAMVLRRLFGWRIAGYLPFTRGDVAKPGMYADRLRLRHDTAWYLWRFGDLRPWYVLPHTRDGVVHHQLWNTRECAEVTAAAVGVDAITHWDPATYSDVPTEWCLALVVKGCAQALPAEVADIRNWYLEIGDSDLAQRSDDDGGIPGHHGRTVARRSPGPAWDEGTDVVSEPIQGWWCRPRVVSVVVDNPAWILPFAERLVVECGQAGDDARLCGSYDEIRPGGVAFFLGCMRLAAPDILGRSHRSLVVHASDLPKGRGFSPATWDVIAGSNRISVCLLDAAEKADSGPVVYRDAIQLEGHELVDEIRERIGAVTINLCRRFLAEPTPPAGVPQEGEPSHYRRRRRDSRLDPARPLADQFDLLRVVDNDEYPAFFSHRGHTYRRTIKKIPPVD